MDIKKYTIQGTENLKVWIEGLMEKAGGEGVELLNTIRERDGELVGDLKIKIKSDFFSETIHYLETYEEIKEIIKFLEKGYFYVLVDVRNEEVEIEGEVLID